MARSSTSSNPGKSNQAVSFTTIRGVTAGKAGLDDVIKPSAPRGLSISPIRATNKVYSFHATGFNTNDYYASVGSLKAFGQVDPPRASLRRRYRCNAGDINFASPHGMVFVPDANAPPMAIVDCIEDVRRPPQRRERD